MKKNLLKLALISSAIAAACPAMADASGGYIGIGFGQSKVSDWFSSSNAEAGLLEDTGATATSSDSDDTGGTWKFFGGYNVNSNFALEGGYISLGQVTAEASAPGAYKKAKAESSALFFNAVGKYQPVSYIDLFAKAGLYTAHSELKDTTDAESVSADHDKLGLHFGVGANAWINENLGARLEWETFKDVEVEDLKSDVSVISASLIYKF